MKKSIILKSFLVILVCTMLVFITTSVKAATTDNEVYEDIFNTDCSILVRDEVLSVKGGYIIAYE